MKINQNSTSNLGQTTLSQIAREETRLAFQEKRITHNQFAINVATNAPAYFEFAPISGEDVENCAELLCRNEEANRKRIERYISGERFDKNLVPALIRSLPEPYKSRAIHRITALFIDEPEEIFDLTGLLKNASKEGLEANLAIVNEVDLPRLAKELSESITAQKALLNVVTLKMARGDV